MPSSLFTLDSELPTLSAKESPQEQIRKMYNYLVQMRQSLQYSLRNLTTDNFSTSALQSLTDGAKTEVTQKLSLMQAALTQMKGTVDSLSGRVGGVEDLAGKVGELADSDELLAGEIAAIQEALDGLDVAIGGEGGILQRLDAAERILAIISIGEDGTISIGTEGIPLHLVGQVSINGEMYGGDSV